MEDILAVLSAFIAGLSNAAWGLPTVALLMGTHLFFTIRLRGIQRYTGLAIKLSVSKEERGAGDVSQFGALTTALAATIGAGNIVGVATAVALGGPGAVFWCWLTGVFGIATKYAEALLSVKYRVKTSDGTMLGGPMYALERGLGAGGAPRSRRQRARRLELRRRGERPHGHPQPRRPAPPQQGHRRRNRPLSLVRPD